MIIKKSFDPAQTFIAGDHTNLQEILHPKNDPVHCDCSVAQASLKPGDSSLPHRLRNQTEIFYFLDGAGKVIVGDDTYRVVSGDLIHIPPDTEQMIENTGDKLLRFLCIVQPPWKAEDEVMEEQ